MSTNTRLLLVDDHEIVRDGIRLLLRKRPDYEIVGNASNGIEALQELNEKDIDLVITDISMPEMDGIALTKSIKDQFPNVKILVLTLHNEEDIVREIAYAEAEGYILKNTGSKELTAALDKISDGGTYYSDVILRMIIKGLKPSNSEKTPKVEVLSDRELEILQLVANEMTTKDIAEALFLSPKTIDTHRKNILRKTGQKTLIGLIKFAIANQIIDFQ